MVKAAVISQLMISRQTEHYSAIIMIMGMSLAAIVPVISEANVPKSSAETPSHVFCVIYASKVITFT